MTEETMQPTSIQVRQAEVDVYNVNIANYQNILSIIDGNWDDDLIHLKDLDMQEAARQCSMEQLERLSELQLHNQVTNLLKTEIVEKTKAQIILNSLINS
jgi:hypothetical protein